MHQQNRDMEKRRLMEVMAQYHQQTDDNIVGVTFGRKRKGGVLTSDRAIVFTVKQKLPQSQLQESQMLPKVIRVDSENVLTDVVQGEPRLAAVSDCIPAFYDWRGTPPTNRDVHRPLECGIAIGNWDNQGTKYAEDQYGVGGWYAMKYFVGTLGLFAKDNETDSLVGITNAHVAIYDPFLCSERVAYPGGNANQVNNVKNDRISQPNTTVSGDTYSIGRVKRYYPLRGNGVYNYTDAAVIAMENSSDISQLTSWHQHGLTAPAYYPWATESEIDDLMTYNPWDLNVQLYSSGRTTGAKGEGTTKLRINSWGMLTIPYNKQGSYVNVLQTDVIEIVATLYATGGWLDTCYDPIVAGDSGSALIADINGTKKIIGLIFGNVVEEATGKALSGLACRIDNLATLLNVSEWNGDLLSYSNTGATEEITVNGLDSRIYIDSGGKRYWQVGLRNI